MKNVFYFISKAFISKCFFCSWDICIFVLTFGYSEKQLDEKVKVNSKTYGVTDWTKINCNTHIVQYLKD